MYTFKQNIIVFQHIDEEGDVAEEVAIEDGEATEEGHEVMDQEMKTLLRMRDVK